MDMSIGRMNHQGAGAQVRHVRGDGIYESNHRVLTDSFHAIDASGISNLGVHCGQRQQGLEISGDRNVLPLVESRVENGVLHIKPVDGTEISPNTPVNVVVSTENLTDFVINGNIVSFVDGIHGHALDMAIADQSIATVQGKLDVLFIHASGDAQLRGQQLSAQSVVANVSGHSGVRITAEERLQVFGSDTSQVAYFGDPNVIKGLSGDAGVYHL